MGFGRGKRAKSQRKIPQGRSKTPKRRMSKKLRDIAPSPINLNNLNKKNVRALVYHDRSASKLENKKSRTQNRRHNHPRELSISSDDESSVDSNQPNSDNDFEEEDDGNSTVSLNRSSRTLKKKKRDSQDIRGIQTRKTKLINYENRKKSIHHKESTSNINIRLGSAEPKQRNVNSRLPRPQKGGTKRSRSKLGINKSNMPTTKPIDSNKSYLKPTKSSHSRVKKKPQNTENGQKKPVMRYKKPSAAREGTAANRRGVSRSKSPINQAAKGSNRGKSKSSRNLRNSRTPNRRNFKGKSQKVLKPVDQNKRGKVKTNVQQKKPKIKKTKKQSLIDDNMFNNDDLFAKLNQLTKLNKKIEKQGLIEDGLIDPEDNLTENELSISEEESDHGQISEDSENFDVHIPNSTAIERKLKKKISSKNRKNDRKIRQQSNKSFIEQQLQQFKEKRRRKIKPSEIDYDRLMNPKHKKKPAELKTECTFQPMLSKKSLNLASKLGNTKERLYTKKSINYSRTPEKYVNKENTFTPKIGAKSKYIDQKKGGHALNRHERLLQMGEKYSAKRKQKKKNKDDEEMDELKSHSFKPRTSQFKGTAFDVSLAERASRWAEKRKEKVKRKRMEIEQRQEQICSFKPKIVKFAKFLHF